MSLLTAIRLGLIKTTDYRSRSTRQEFWLLVLGQFLFLMVIGIAISEPWIFNAIAYGTSIPILISGIRRLHDTNRSGWWILVPFASIVFLCFAGDLGENRFGPPPPPIS
jgi:uncharacterized membrane protein YhaH (DUF805 family)